MKEQSHLCPRLERTTTGEWVWQRLRDRVPESPFNWTKFILLCGPEPGQPLDPNEIYPPKLEHIRLKERRRQERAERRNAGRLRGGVGAAHDVAPVIERVPTPPAVLSFREKVFESLKEQHPDGIPSETLFTLAHLLGYAPSENEKRRLEASKVTSQRQFDDWVHTLEEDQDVEAMLAPFRALDPKKTGFLSEFSLKVVLTSFGEALTEAQVDEILKGVKKSGQAVNYEELVRTVVPEDHQVADADLFQAKLNVSVPN